MTSFGTGTKDTKNVGRSSAKETQFEADHFVAFIGNIPSIIDRPTLLGYLKGFGPLKHLSLPIDVRTGRHKGFAKAFFYSEAQLAKVAYESQNYSLCGVHLAIQKWVPRRLFTSKKEQPAPNKAFFRMAHPFSYKELYRLFSQFGKVTEIDLKTDRHTEEERDYGFVTFESEASVRQMIPDGKKKFRLAGKVLLVSTSKSNKQISAEIKAKVKPKEGSIPINFPLKEHQGTSHQQIFLLNKIQTSRRYPHNSKAVKGELDEYQDSEFLQQDLSDEETFGINIRPSSMYWHHPTIEVNHENEMNLCFRICKKRIS